MAFPTPSKTHSGNHQLHPETRMMNYGYDSELSEGAVKPPVFLTSTFVFKTAEDGRDFFDYVSGRREPPDGVGAGLVYSRFNHSNSEIVEDRLAVYERAESTASAKMATTPPAHQDDSRTCDLRLRRAASSRTAFPAPVPSRPTATTSRTDATTRRRTVLSRRA